MPTRSSAAHAWQADTIDDPEGWYYPLAGTCLAALRDAARAGQGRPVTELGLGAGVRAAGATDLRPVLDALEEGRGFAILRGPSPGQSSPEQARALYWLTGQLL